MAEQIRQQQLAAALESRLDSQSFSAMQAALLMNKLKAGAAMAASAETSLTAATSNKPAEKKKSSKASTSMGDKLNKNTVASLLAKSRELTSDDLEQAEQTWNRPELTIEPLFRKMKPDQRYVRTCCLFFGKLRSRT